MDQRIESFLADVLALAGENPDAIREGVRVALADCEAIFRAQETNKKRHARRAALVGSACNEIRRGLVRLRGSGVHGRIIDPGPNETLPTRPASRTSTAMQLPARVAAPRLLPRDA
jgi:hypothetical protein